MTSAADLADELAELRRRVKTLERAPRLANASIEGHPLLVNDGDQQLRQTIGLQADGTYTVVDTNGPPPPVPSPPILEARAGTLVVTWDGTFAGNAAAPADWDHVEVHVFTVPGYVPNDSTEVITFHSLKGGSVTLALNPVAQYVVLQAVNTSRVESAPTAQVAGTPLPAATGAGGVKTYLETDPPIGLVAADDGALWYDTNDGNHPYRWAGGTVLAWVSIRDTTIAAAQAAAANALTTAQTAQTTADGKAVAYFQPAEPTGQVPGDVGDLWFDTDDGNKMWRYSGTAWVVAQDQSIATALTNAAAASTAAGVAQSTADSKIVTLYQTAAPSGAGRTVGDLWVDTDDGNHLYRWDGAAWVSVRDTTIATASAAASSAQTQANTALTAAQAAQATADGAIRTYYTATAPTGLNATSDVGDLWFNTTDQSAHRWSGTAWVLIQDTSIATALAAAQNAQTTADGKITAYYQISPPTVGEVGDLWYDTDDKNKPYFCSTASAPGPVVWTVVRDLTIADAQAAANAAQATANSALGAATTDGLAPTSSPACEMVGGVGAILFRWTPITNPNRVTYKVYASTTAGFTADATTLVGVTAASQLTVRNLNGGVALAYGTTYYGKVIATDADGPGPVGVETFAQMVQITTPDVSAAYVYAGNIVVNQLTGGSLSADVVMGATLRTALTGQRVEIGPLGIITYDSAGIPQTVLPSGTGENNVFKGLIETAGITATGAISMRSTDNEIIRGAALTLNSGVTASKSAPSVVVDWETINLDTVTAFGVPQSTLGPSHAIAMCAAGAGSYVVAFKSSTAWGWATFQFDGTVYLPGPRKYVASSVSSMTQIACKSVTAPVFILSGTSLARWPGTWSRTFFDDFSGTLSQWTATGTTIVAGKARLAGTSGSPASLVGPVRTFMEKTVSASFDMTGFSSAWTFQFQVKYDANNYLEISNGIAGLNVLRFRYVQGGTANDTTLAYDSTQHQYFRFENADNGIVFYTSPDGVTWTSRKSLLHTFTAAQLNGMHPEFIASTTGLAINQDIDNVEINWTQRSEPSASSSSTAALGTDGTDMWVAELNGASPPAFVINTMSDFTMRSLATVTTAANSGFTGNLAGITKVNDSTWGAGARWVIGDKTGAYYWPFNVGTNAYESTNAFAVPTGGSKGIAYDAAFWTLNASGQFAKHTNNTWTSSGDPENWWSAFSWFDSNAAGAAPGQHETPMSTQANFSMHKRARYTVTTPAIPVGLGTTDDVDSVRLYIGRGGTAPARTAMWLQGTSPVGSNSMIFNTASFAGTNPPAANNFPASGSAGRIRNSDDTLVISGDGSIVAASVTTSALVVSTDDPWHTVGAAGEPAFANGWVANAGFTVQFRKDIAGNVHIRGTVQTGTFGATVFTLPVGYRPLTISSVNYLAPNANPVTATPLVSITTSTGALSISQRTGVATVVAINTVFPTK